jgi:hypothetical protein
MLFVGERLDNFVASLFERNDEEGIEWYEFLDFLLVLKYMPRPLIRRDVETQMKYKDSEGNAYAPLMGCDDNVIYTPTSEAVFDLSLPADEHCMTEQKWTYTKKTYPRCLVMYPTH